MVPNDSPCAHHINRKANRKVIGEICGNLQEPKLSKTLAYPFSMLFRVVPRLLLHTPSGLKPRYGR